MFKELVRRFMNGEPVILTRLIPGSVSPDFDFVHNITPIFNFDTGVDIPAGLYTIRQINFGGAKQKDLFVFLDRSDLQQKVASMRPVEVAERAGGFLLRSIEEFESLFAIPEK